MLNGWMHYWSVSYVQWQVYNIIHINTTFAQTLHYQGDGTLHRGYAYDKILLKEKHIMKQKER